MDEAYQLIHDLLSNGTEIEIPIGESTSDLYVKKSSD